MNQETVTSVTHWTEELFSFRTTRPKSLRFRTGEFTMIGLPGQNGKPLLRAYSIASPSWDEELEFYSIKVPDGPLTSKLQHIKVGDQVFVNLKPVGTLVFDALLPGETLWLFSTGTGFAPFASVLRDPETYEKFKRVVVCHGVRHKQDFAYSESLLRDMGRHEVLKEFLPRISYWPTTTRESSFNMGRVTDQLACGDLLTYHSMKSLDPERDRAMVCGSLPFNTDMSRILKSYGLVEGANSGPGHFVLEKAFVEEKK